MSVPRHHRAAILYSKEDLRIEDVSTIPPQDNEVTIRIHATGLCGSDRTMSLCPEVMIVHYYAHGRNGPFELKGPIILGHESAGEVVAVGASARDLKPGDRVTIEPGIPCANCPICSRGTYNLCPNLVFPSSCKLFPHPNGTLQTYFNHPPEGAHKIPDTMSFEEGALCEPLSVALQAHLRTGFREESWVKSVTIFGAGAVGLLIGAVSKYRGAKVNILDIDEARLEFAKDYCADEVYQLEWQYGDSIAEAKEMATLIAEAIGQSDIIYECTGASACLQAAIYLAMPGTQIGMVGIGPPTQTLPIHEAALREVDLIGIFRYRNRYPEAIDLIASGKIDVKPLITSLYNLEETKMAFEDLRSGKVIKPIITY